MRNELKYLDELLEGTVDWGADVVALVEVDGGDGTLGDAFGGELEFLERKVSKCINLMKEEMVCEELTS